MVRIIGSYISPYVRKVLVVLDTKGLFAELGAPLLAETYGTTSPRRGMMRI